MASKRRKQHCQVKTPFCNDQAVGYRQVDGRLVRICLACHAILNRAGVTVKEAHHAVV